jgi:histidinol-phosphate aminotransferase
MNINNLLRENIKKMQPYSSARDEFKDFDKELIFLDANENPYENGVNRYPDNMQKTLKNEIAKIKKVPTENIVLGNGSDEILDLVFRAFCNPNIDNVITLPPTYGMYSVLANLNAIENREVLLTEDFQLNVPAILEKVTKNTKIIFLCSPNNPTGNSLNDEDIVTILKNFSGIVVLDEAYIDFSSKDSWLQELQDYPNLVISQTLSKAYAMAGLRLGILFASTEIANILNKIKPPYNVNILTQKTALQNLQNLNLIKNQIESIKTQRNIVYGVLLNLNFVKEIYATDANFILVKVDDANKRYNEILAKGIVLRNRTTQPLCENCLRITIGTEEENNTLIAVLKSLT